MATGTLRLIFLWHMHQPFYKDLVTGEYRLPWVRMHALKDYYGMVKLLDEFPDVHQNFNLVPSLIAQIQDYARGTFRDPFYEVVAKPAQELTAAEKRFSLQYLFQAHTTRMIGRYPRYKQLFERVNSAGPDPTLAEHIFSTQDYADLQVLSQLAWFDEYYLAEPEIQELVKKGSGFSVQDQKVMLRWQSRIMNSVLPAYAAAAKKGSVELSTTPYYHPILPLLCDTNAGAESSPGLPLPSTRFRHPDDAREQMARAVELHKDTFGVKPRGAWPSEGSVSDDAVAVAASVGIEWMATDEGVLGRSLGTSFDRDGNGALAPGAAAKLYNIYKYESDHFAMNMVFRDHRLSDLIGFVYAGMPAADAAAHLVGSLKAEAAPVLNSGRDAVLSIILDGENAWENFEHSGREFLRRLYDQIQRDPQIESVSIAEAIDRTKPETFGRLKGLVPGSWINANFNVWIGAPEDNRAWEYLNEAREFYDENARTAREEKREIAYEELLIAEGSDWNWWYGPEHHSANDRDFDELYRKHLSNVYSSLGAVPPDDLARPIAGGVAKPTLTLQSAYVRPHIDGYASSYFEWMGAAMYTSDRRTGSMHGKQFLLDAIYSGIDEEYVYGRMDFSGPIPSDELLILVNCAVERHGERVRRVRIEAVARQGKLEKWSLLDPENGEFSESAAQGATVALGHIFEFKLPLKLIGAELGMNLNLQFTVYKASLPADALPVEGSLAVQVLPEEALLANSYTSV